MSTHNIGFDKNYLSIIIKFHQICTQFISDAKLSQVYVKVKCSHIHLDSLTISFSKENNRYK